MNAAVLLVLVITLWVLRKILEPSGKLGCLLGALLAVGVIVFAVWLFGPAIMPR